MKEFLEQLLNIPSPPGGEAAAAEYIASCARPFADRVRVDIMGNLILQKVPKGGPGDTAAIPGGPGDTAATPGGSAPLAAPLPALSPGGVMVICRMDEPGFMVSAADEKGFLRIAALGGITAEQLCGREVLIAGRRGIAHCEKSGDIKLPDIFIEMYDAKETPVGSLGTVAGGVPCLDGPVFGGALSVKAACAAMLQCFCALPGLPFACSFVFAAQGQLGSRGAAAAAEAIAPELCISVGACAAGDIPGGKTSIKLGGGPVLKLSDAGIICSPEVTGIISDSAGAQGIPLQRAAALPGSWDDAPVHISRGGVRTGGIALPVRYLGASAERADMEDITRLSKLLGAAVAAAL